MHFEIDRTKSADASRELSSSPASSEILSEKHATPAEIVQDAASEEDGKEYPSGAKLLMIW